MADNHPTFEPIPKGARFPDYTGRTFGHAAVLGFAGRKADSQGWRIASWWCRCLLCGTIFRTLGNSLQSGNTTSCGCLRHERAIAARRTHGKSYTPEYRTWRGMMSRCRNPRSTAFHCYGGRGIRVCERWNDFALFLADVGLRPTPRHTIERIDNDRGYSCGHCEECQARGEPANCRWATRKEQGNNTRRNHPVTFRGETHNVAEWATITGLNARTIYARLKTGRSPEEAFTAPSRYNGILIHSKLNVKV